MIRLVWLVAMISPIFTVAAQSHSALQSRLQLAEACTLIGSRLERLACFDDVFATPLAIDNQYSPTLTSSVNPRHDAFVMEAERGDKQGFLYRSERISEQQSNHWLTASAIGSAGTRPVLMLSCVNKISRVEIYFPQPVDANVINVTVRAGRSNRQAWQFDDSGTKLRSGRGLPAIEIMKTMLTGRSMEIQSEHHEVNGLRFDSQNLRQELAPLRQQCGW